MSSQSRMNTLGFLKRKAWTKIQFISKVRMDRVFTVLLVRMRIGHFWRILDLGKMRGLLKNGMLEML